MYCKMDVEDSFRADPAEYRRMGCDCASMPGQPRAEHGCECPACARRCTECPGYGYVNAPEKGFHQVLSRVRAGINRHVSVRGFPPGFVRVTRGEAGLLRRKYLAEHPDHWIRTYVDLGPPMKLFDVIAVTDLRRTR